MVDVGASIVVGTAYAFFWWFFYVMWVLATSGQYFTEHLYQELGTLVPKWAPPMWAWSLISVLVGIGQAFAGWLGQQLANDRGEGTFGAGQLQAFLIILVIFILIQNGWPIAFFSFASFGWALFYLFIVFALSVLLTVVGFLQWWPIGLVLVPTVLWYGYGLALNWKIWRVAKNANFTRHHVKTTYVIEEHQN